GDPTDEDDTGLPVLPPEELAERETLASLTIDLSGQVLRDDGTPFQGATVWAGTQSTTTDASGHFTLEDLTRHNVLLRVEATGWRTRLAPVWLHQPTDVDEVVVDPLYMAADQEGVVRFLFGGDVSFGGRYLDPEEQYDVDEMPVDNPDASIQVSDPLPGTRKVLEAIAPLFEAADYGVVSLDSAVTDALATAHPEKQYHRYTLPGSLAALPEIGMDLVSLGNEHVYDYLDPGTADTLDHVGAAGLAHAGAGLTSSEAWAPWRETLGGADYSFVSASSISGRWYTPSYVATADKGGAADLTDTAALRDTLLTERGDGQIPIALLHIGSLQYREPTAIARTQVSEAIDAGAALVVGHHTHVPQGFGEIDGVPVVWGLGNLALDQQRLETQIGMLVQADLYGGESLGLWGIPVQLEDFQPRPVAASRADVAARYVAEFSEVPTYAYNGRVWMGAGVPEDRSVEVTVDVPQSGWAVLDLRGLLEPGESLSEASGPVQARPGRDLMIYGSMEDQDVDDNAMEVPHWSANSPSRFPCVTGARRGTVGLCSTRSATNLAVSVIGLRYRIRVWGDAENEPNKDLSVFGWFRADGAGPLEVETRYMASLGDAVLGGEFAYTHPGGTFGWQAFAADLSMPDDVVEDDDYLNPRAARLYLRHRPPATGSGVVHWDDLAMISWEETLDLAGGAALQTPHVRDFLRVEAAPGSYTLDLTLRRYRPY
ncbi:MAG: CapA family protein, partial [Deltaproteobacteria bacterium]|nr:CapA family protein [Deltaproteobacteria bacterium]